ncbi:MADS-box protein SOC1-like isoform X2 [Prosopis cineraria]|uniref:MADS-box protein SOC1-like isoform X2 n=1 Tax=Prosopis cineraria TaxID=364024 RepID=UPI00240FFF33|nr:MADS-box protein SOC1-like isoform X2 [Prosopis cineraria]
MVRRKIQMKRIENKSSRQVTFSKRRNGMLKKAFELSVLCEVEVALIIFSSRGKLYEFSSSSVQETIERYRNYVRDSQKANPYLGQNMEHLKQQTASMKKMIDGLEASKRKLSGENLNSCSLQELQELEEQLRKSVKKVQERKNQVFKEKMEKLKEKGKAQTDENARLSVKTLILVCAVGIDEKASKTDKFE